MDEGQPEFLPPVDLAMIKKLLPHRYPMLLLDRIVDVTRDRGAVGIKNVTVNEPFFEGHFPDKPVMPGVLIIEALAQAAAAYTAYVEEVDTEGKIVLFMGVDKARFRKPVIPGDQLKLHVNIAARRPPVWKYEGVAMVDGQTVAEANYSAMLIDAAKAP